MYVKFIANMIFKVKTSVRHVRGMYGTWIPKVLKVDVTVGEVTLFQYATMHCTVLYSSPSSPYAHTQRHTHVYVPTLSSLHLNHTHIQSRTPRPTHTHTHLDLPSLHSPFTIHTYIHTYMRTNTHNTHTHSRTPRPTWVWIAW